MGLITSLLWLLAGCDPGRNGRDGTATGDGGAVDGGALDGGTSDGGGHDGGTPDGGGHDGGSSDGGGHDGGGGDGGGSDDTGVGMLSPELEAGRTVTLPVPTAEGLPVVTGFTVNARIHGHGQPCTWQVDHGPTRALGTSTVPRALPPALGAWLREDWTEGTNAWLAGIGGAQLSHHPSGGPDGGPFVRYTDDGTAGNDTNHLDGIGIIHLGLYGYSGHYDDGGVPALYMGGGFPDLRGARFTMDLRGVDWVANGTTLGTWIQGYRDVRVTEVVPEDSRYPNWAWTAGGLTEHLASGEWERAEWTLRSRSDDWTFAGANGGRLLYDYGELDSLLSHVNVDLFPIQILGVDLSRPPAGGIDYDALTIQYRQHSLTAPGNGGSLISEPAGGAGAALLTDGWRNGEGHEWWSDVEPEGDQAFVYAFADPIMLFSLTIHNSVAWPSDRVDLEVSPDGGSNWERVGGGSLPMRSSDGPNLLFLHESAWRKVAGVNHWSPLFSEPVDRLRVTVRSGHQAERWGLGEIEAFGTGATKQTEDDWTDVHQDIRVAPGTWYHRSIVRCTGGEVRGEIAEVVVP